MTPNKSFLGDLQIFESKLKNKESFAFSKYADGEWHVLKKNEPINNGEFSHDPNSEHDLLWRQELIKSFLFVHDQYYVGITCPCCGGSETFQQMKKACGSNDDHITWANIWVNSNYKYYVENILPLYNNYKVCLICNEDADISHLPFKLDRYYGVGKSAWSNSQNLIRDLSGLATTTNNMLYLFACGPLGNLLSHRLLQSNPNNTYLDVGSTLDNYFGFGVTRQYLNLANQYAPCIWE